MRSNQKEAPLGGRPVASLRHAKYRVPFFRRVQPEEPRPPPEPPDGPAKGKRGKRRPMRRRTKWILAVSVAAALVVGAVCGISWKAGQDLLHPERQASALTPGNLNLTWQWANFTTGDGVEVVGWWVPASAVRANGTVIFLHGYSESKAQGLALTPFLHNASYNVLLFDFRAHGESGGDHTTVGLRETQEVSAAVAWVRGKAGHGDARTFILGWSMGAAAALNAAAGQPGVGGIVADASFSKLQNIVDTSISHFTGLPKWPFGPLAVLFASASAGIEISDNEPAKAIADYRGPLLLIQGLDDVTVTPEQVDEIAAAAPQATVWKVPGCVHTECYKIDRPGYEAKVLEFLAQG